MNDRLTVATASKLLHLAPESVRYYMEIGKLPIGIVVPSRSGRTKRYIIIRGQLEKFIGRELEAS